MGAAREAGRDPASLVGEGYPLGTGTVPSILLVVTVILNSLLVPRYRLPKIKASDDIVTQFIFISIDDLSQVSVLKITNPNARFTYLSRRCVQPPDILRCDDVYKGPTLHMPYLNEAGLESENVRMEDGKSLWSTFPCNPPVWPSPPTIPVDEERVVGVAKEELACQTLDVDWLDVLLAHDKVERGIGLIEQ